MVWRVASIHSSVLVRGFFEGTRGNIFHIFQTQDSAQEETKVPESIEAQIEEPIAYELKMAKPLEGKIQIPYDPKKLSLEEEPTLCGLFGFSLMKIITL